MTCSLARALSLVSFAASLIFVAAPAQASCLLQPYRGPVKLDLIRGGLPTPSDRVCGMASMSPTATNQSRLSLREPPKDRSQNQARNGAQTR